MAPATGNERGWGDGVTSTTGFGTKRVSSSFSPSILVSSSTNTGVSSVFSVFSVLSDVCVIGDDVLRRVTWFLLLVGFTLGEEGSLFWTGLRGISMLLPVLHQRKHPLRRQCQLQSKHNTLWCC